jgi:hypothetical protein
MLASLDSFRLSFFGLAPSREARFLTAEMRAGFQFVVLTTVAVEIDDLFLCFADFRHGVLPSVLSATSVAWVFWLSGAEAPASRVASASSYRFAENVMVLPVVVAELKLIQVERKVLLADVVVRPDDAPLEQRPERFDVVRMNVAAHILIFGMLHAIVIEAKCGQVVITGMFIGRDQRHAVTDSFADKAVERSRVGLFDYLTTHVTLAADSSDHRGLAAKSSDMLLFVPMAILILAANAHFINFDDSHELLEIVIPHASPKPMADEPCGMQGRALAEEHAPNLTGRNAFQALEHRVENLEPSHKRDVGIFENRADQNRESIGICRVAFLANPIEGPGFKGVNLFVPAARAAHTVRPTAILQVLTAARFVGKRRHELLEGHHA